MSQKPTAQSAFSTTHSGPKRGGCYSGPGAETRHTYDTKPVRKKDTRHGNTTVSARVHAPGCPF